MSTSHLFHDKDMIVRGNIFDITVENLRIYIDKANLSPGDKLPSERELQQGFGVSRSILREALRVIEAQGLINIVQGKGAYVKKPGLQTVIEPVQRLIKDGSITLRNLMEARNLLEPEIARLACLNASEKQLTLLEQDFYEMTKYLDFPEKYLESDKNFHSRLAGFSGNPVLVIMMWPLINLFTGFIPLFYERPGTPQKVFSGHKTILEALRSRDPARAVAAMKEHLSIVTEWFGPLANEPIIDNDD